MAFSARSIYSERLAALYTLGYGALIDAIAGALEQANPALDARREAVQAVAHDRRPGVAAAVRSRRA